MKFKQRNGLKIISVGLLASMLLSVSSGVYARDNYAYAAGIQHNLDNLIPWVDDFDAYDDCYNALIEYQKAGYNVAGHTNPTKEVLWSNLYATVQFFAGHGSTNNICFTGSGIAQGSDITTYVTLNGKKTLENVEFIGTNRVNWDADTILVTYSCCNGAGYEGLVSDSNIVRTTCEEGADVTVGFTDSVHPMYMDDWTDRYNQQLGAGVGVYNAKLYANSFSYLLGGQKNNIVYYHTDPNMKIGVYGNSTKSLLNEKLNLSSKVSQYEQNGIAIQDITSTNTKIINDKSMEERNVLGNKRAKIAFTEANIEKELKNMYNNFDKENYVVDTYTSLAVNINTNEVTDNYTYHDYKLKIGDYLTDAAYTVVVKDNMIDAIYDNNIDIQKQEQLLKDTSKFKVDVNESVIADIDIKTEDLIQAKYDGTVTTTNKDYTYYYDIKNDEKYIIASYETEMQVEEKDELTAVSNYKYKLD